MINRFRRRHRRTSNESIYGPARHRAVDAEYAAALIELGNLCQKNGGVALRRLPFGVPGRNLSADNANVTAPDTPASRVHVVAFHGELDLSNQESIETALAVIQRLAPATIPILDLTDVRYLDTTFLNALLRLEQRRNDAGSRPRIVAPRASMPSRILAITQLDLRFDVFADLASAQR